MFFRRDASFPESDFSDPEQLWLHVREGFRRKADHNKNETQLIFCVSLLFSVSAPLFIAFGETTFLGKIVPASMSAIVAACTGWIQLRKPQRLWAIYRRAQRELEHEKIMHDNAIEHYSGHTSHSKFLAERITQISLGAHEAWEAAVPDSEALKSTVDDRTVEQESVPPEGQTG